METNHTNESLLPQDDEISKPHRNSKVKKKIGTILTHPRSLQAVGFVSKVKKNSEKVVKELLVRGLAVQLYYVLHDVRHWYGLYCGPKHTRARENIRLLFLHNLPKYLVVVWLVGRIPFPGTTEALRAILYNNPKLRKHRNMKFQVREDIPADIAVTKLKQYGYQIIIILNTMA